jgi:streptogramin lyase
MATEKIIKTRRLYISRIAVKLCCVATLLLVSQLGFIASAAAECASKNDPAQCQWTESVSGGIWGAPENTAPPPSLSSTNPICSTTQCSDGIRQQSGTTNILFNTDYETSGPTTTCRFVDNLSGSNIFVPQNSRTEFVDFVENAPAGIGFGYCVQAANPSYKASATIGNGCSIFTANGPVTCPPGVTPATQQVTLELPVVRVTNPPAEVTLPSITFTYTREDCRNDASGAVVCQAHTIVETQAIQATVAPNPSAQCQNPQRNLNLNCDGTWQITATPSCTVDGVPSTTCLSNFSPPPPRQCTVDGVTYTNGATWNVTLPSTSGCPAVPGTPESLTCTDGAISVLNPGVAAVIDSCAPPPSSFTIYVVDKNNDRVEAFDTHGNFQFQFGAGHGSGNGQFVEAYGIHFDQNNQAMITDSGNARVETFTTAGGYTSQFGSSGSSLGQFMQPDEVAQAPSGTIWVTDITASTITAFDSSHAPILEAGGLNRPTGVAFDAGGNTWVINSGTNTIKKLDGVGNTVFEFGSPGSGPGQFNFAWDLAFDASNRMWVADSGNDRIQVFDDSGNYLFQFGVTGSGNGQFNLPIDLAIDPNGNVWVTDQGNNRVQEFDNSGNYLFQFGSTGSNPGQFTAPVGITIH